MADKKIITGAGEHRVEVAAGERVELVGALLGQGRMAIEVCLLGPRAEVSVDALFLATDRQHAAIEVNISHLHPDCRSRTSVKGIAAGHAVGEFTGRIYVAPDAQRTHAQQQSRNILLSDTARIHTRPQLEIYADDVRCAHGATLGQLDPDTLHYMRQRGLDIPTARRLQLEGFIAEVSRYIDISLDSFF